MPKELVLVKSQDGSLRPATQADQELMSQFKLGQPVRVQVTKMKQRSLPMHRMYFGGLLELACDYWEPKGGLIGSMEVSTLKRFADWLDCKGGNSGSIRRACKVFLSELMDSRAKHIDAPEKSKQALHEWVKIEAGYFRYELSPTGIRKVPLSINFNAMSQDDFNLFYKAAFTVVWNFILSRCFDDEAQAEQAVNQLLSMG
jgi:hypothetical protein